MLDALLALVAGLLIGSFLNVCIYRMPRDISVISPRSFCPACNKPVAWYDNVPVLSYFLLGGRCRDCRKPIPIRYPLVELLTGLIFFVIFEMNGVSLRSVKLCTFAALMIGLIFSDLEERILPDQFTLGGTALGIGFALLVPLPPLFALFLPDWSTHWRSLAESLFGAAFITGLLALIRWAYFKVRQKEGLGIGDLKMMALIGSFFGLAGSLQTMFLGSILGSIVGVIYIYIARKDASSYELPFGTFLGIAALGLALLNATVLQPAG